MREIKLRAFDKELRKFCYMTISSINIETNYPNGWVNGTLSGWELFTGLKDKNGKDIYEGDIVERDNIFAGVQRGVISIDPKRGTLVGQNDYEQHPTVIIGNIHENPELLK